jgi:predicted nuclease of predicted toxin-antitoxin system
MRLLLDMNITPALCEALGDAGWECIHWAAVGDPCASDAVILEYARTHRYAVLTHDLDFSAVLSATRAKAPSVVQIRVQDVLSDHFRDVLLRALRQFQAQLESGALLVVDESRSKARLLPIT